MNIEERIARTISLAGESDCACGEMETCADCLAKTILDLGDPSIREILESCQYDKGYEAALARKVKGTSFTVGELVERAEEGKLVELDENQSWPSTHFSDPTAVRAWESAETVARADGFRRIVR